MNILQKILAVIRRELRIIRKRPVYIVGSVGVVAFCCVFFLTFFGKGLPDELPVGIVDNDNSTTSREFCEQFNSTQLSRVIRFDTFSQARDEMTRGNVFAVIVIPEGMNADVMANRQPHVSFYTNGLYFLGGALSWKNILQMVNLTCGAVQREVLRMKGYNEDEIMGMIRPVDIDTHQIGNPGTNYDYLLSGMLIPAMIAMCVMMILIYSLGAELKFGTSRHLLETSGGSMGAAVGGKCLLWAVIFSVLGCIAILVMYHWLGFPVAGSVWGMMLDMVLLIVHHRDDSGPPPGAQHRSPVQHPEHLDGRFLFPSGRNAACHPGPGPDVPAQTLLPFLCTGSNPRNRIRRLVERGSTLPCVRLSSDARNPQTRKGLHLPELSKRLENNEKQLHTEMVR